MPRNDRRRCGTTDPSTARGPGVAFSLRQAKLICALLCVVPACDCIDHLGACFGEGPLPAYPQPSPTLRLIPESAAVGPEGGPLFVDVELQATSVSSVIFIAGHGAMVAPLPGPPLCDTKSADSSDGGAQAGNDADGGPRSDAATPADAVRIPSAATFEGAPDAVRRTGVMVNVPAGDTDATLTATAYAQAGDASSCAVFQNQLIAVGFLRIGRTKPASDAGAGDATSSRDAADAGVEARAPDAPNDAMAPGTDAGANDAMAPGTDAGAADARAGQ
jgi:hypothetical protein